jgi:hypothetical protein
MFLIRTVFGYSPLPQSLKDPKSLYQSPSGANGSAFTQACRRWRSESGILRSFTRWRRCCHKPRGRSENRIFGNCIFPEDGSDQVPPSFLLLRRFTLFEELPIRRLELLFSVFLGSNSSLRQGHESAANRKVTFLSDSSNFGGQRRRDADALTNCAAPVSMRKRLGPGGHDPIVTTLHHCGFVWASCIHVRVL